MAQVVLDNVWKSYAGAAAVRGVSLTIAPGEFLTLLGPSGCGKTTCMRMIAGFVQPSSGRVHMDGRDVTAVPAHKRDTGMVFQSYALFPHQTVAQNVAFGLKVRGLPRREINERTDEALRLVHLDHLAGRYPAQLSGGQAQRVALARAVVIRPKVLLLDEPLAALDLKLREELQIELKRVQTTLGITTLFVTHDQTEALGLSDRVAVMRDGEILQIGPPTDIYQRPASRYVANFVGRTNLFAGTVTARQDSGQQGRHDVTLDGGEGHVMVVEGPQHRDHAAGTRCLVAVRPEKLSLTPVATQGNAATINTVALTVVSASYQGSTWRVELADPQGASFLSTVATGVPPRVGDAVTAQFSPQDCFLLTDDADGG